MNRACRDRRRVASRRDSTARRRRGRAPAAPGPGDRRATEKNDGRCAARDRTEVRAGLRDVSLSVGGASGDASASATRRAVLSTWDATHADHRSFQTTRRARERALSGSRHVRTHVCDTRDVHVTLFIETLFTVSRPWTPFCSFACVRTPSRGVHERVRTRRAPGRARCVAQVRRGGAGARPPQGGWRSFGSRGDVGVRGRSRGGGDSGLG